MAQMIINNGDSGLVARTAINDNNTELYGGSVKIAKPTSGPFIVAGEGCIICDSSTLGFTVTLPDPATEDRIIFVKNLVGSANSITVDAAVGTVQSGSLTSDVGKSWAPVGSVWTEV